MAGGHDDELFGGDGDDVLSGAGVGINGDSPAGNDILYGSAGADSLSGEDGSDIIFLGAADGAGDVVAVDADDSRYSQEDRLGVLADRLYDFEAGIDVLSFAGIEGPKNLLIQTLDSTSFVYLDIGGDGSWDITVIVVDEITTAADVDLGADAAVSPLSMPDDPMAPLDPIANPGAPTSLHDGWLMA